MKQQLITAFEAAPRGLQSRVADALGVRPQTVNKWAKGQTTPDAATLDRLATLLRSEGISFDDVVPREMEPTLMQLVRGIAEEMALMRHELQRMGAAVSKLTAQPHDPVDPPSPRPQAARPSSRRAAP